MKDWKGERLAVETYNSVTAEHLHRYAVAVEFANNKNVLDIASGEGYGSNILASVAAHVTGVDISEDAIKHAQKKYASLKNLSFSTGSLQKIPLTDNSIEVAVSFESIEHVVEHDGVMAELKRVLTPGGILIMSTPDKYQYSDLPKYKNPFHLRELYQDEFKTLIRQYFKYSSFFSQRFYSGSFVIPQSGQVNERIKMFTGNYSHTKTYNPVAEPMYILAIASDAEVKYNAASFFNLTAKIEENYDKSYNRLLHSKSYKLGNFFIRRLAFLRDKLSR